MIPMPTSALQPRLWRQIFILLLYNEGQLWGADLGFRSAVLISDPFLHNFAATPGFRKPLLDKWRTAKIEKGYKDVGMLLSSNPATFLNLKPISFFRVCQAPEN